MKRRHFGFLLLEIILTEHLVCNLLQFLNRIKLYTGLLDIFLDKGWQGIKILVDLRVCIVVCVSVCIWVYI